MSGKASDRDTDTGADVESTSGNEPLREEAIARLSPPYNLHIHAVRKRLADTDGISAKQSLMESLRLEYLAMIRPSTFKKSVLHKGRVRNSKEEKVIVTISEVSDE